MKLQRSHIQDRRVLAPVVAITLVIATLLTASPLTAYVADSGSRA